MSPVNKPAGPNTRDVTRLRLASALLMGCGLAGCGAPPPKEPTATPGTDEASRCLEDAAAPRHPPSNAPRKIAVAHILVRHQELAGPRGATRSRDAACLRALEALQQLSRDPDFKAVAKAYSDSPSAELGRVGPDDLDPDFAAAAFSLSPHELSYVVETRRGFHIILRQE